MLCGMYYTELHETFRVHLPSIEITVANRFSAVLLFSSIYLCKYFPLLFLLMENYLKSFDISETHKEKEEHQIILFQ